jgi:hypothetical protein
MSAEADIRQIAAKNEAICSREEKMTLLSPGRPGDYLGATIPERP